MNLPNEVMFHPLVLCAEQWTLIQASIARAHSSMDYLPLLLLLRSVSPYAVLSKECV